ncbi:hypothetical protein [Streptacidiphilus jiangxiensis]|uniref:Uncharacterized protein n=1 Tax=Streptacidiphilus jiangxiensis TaxID=235985 RepID=A0A1H7V645_STRJI|nr:hypothetical protein [Streptacidiphilus jiangxiensis]SEM04673.1 hypothetical protein SAMN05414137_117112 [Streptacidiphilus jiangxiensis]
MGILILVVFIALLVLGLERNARLRSRQLPTGSAWSTPHEARDRDTERVRDELRARARGQA